MRNLRKDAKFIDLELAKKMYWEDGLYLRHVSQYFKVAPATLLARFRKFGIPTRSRGATLKTAWKPWKANHPDQPKHRRKRINGENRLIHRVIAEGVLGRPLTNQEMVHHIDGNRLNNENSNLLICTRSYHAWLHRKLQKLFKEKSNGSI
ncbi:MAG: HNH endonuclease signature motif containing protein [Dehalococcoidia bacterium]